MSGQDAFHELAADVGLHLGRLISLSKSRYRERHPDHVVVFNASLATGAGEHIWWGDIDLTTDEPLLAELARRAGIELYVYFEYDSRPGLVKAIDVHDAVAVIHPDRSVSFGTRTPHARDARGRIVPGERPPEDREPGPVESGHAQG